MGLWRVINLGSSLVRRLVVSILGLAALLQLEPTMTMAASMLVSLLVYAATFGFQFALGFILLLYIHEIGHVIACRVVGIPASSLVFVPFVGALLRLKRPPVNAKMEANIAIAGPALGTLSALICLVFYLWDNSILMLVLSYTACLLNLFNLIPCDPLDGGKIVAAISSRAWWLGSIAIGLVFCYTHNIFILAIFIFSLSRLWQAVDSSPGYYRLAIAQRLTVLWWYLGLVLILGITTIYVANLLRL